MKAPRCKLCGQHHFSSQPCLARQVPEQAAPPPKRRAPSPAAPEPKRKSPTEFVGVRLPVDLLARVDRFAEASGIKRSAAIRKAIHSGLPSERK